MAEKETRAEWDTALNECQNGELEQRYDNGRIMRGRIHSIVPRKHQLVFYFEWIADKKGKQWKKRKAKLRRPIRLRIDVELFRLKDGRFRFRYEFASRRADKRTCYLIPSNSKLLLDESSL